MQFFRNKGNQAVAIPLEFELPGDSAIIRRDGDRLIIEPLRKTRLLALLASWEPLDDAILEMEDRPAPAEEIFE